jgi:hypothetical protein
MKYTLFPQETFRKSLGNIPNELDLTLSTVCWELTEGSEVYFYIEYYVQGHPENIKVTIEQVYLTGIGDSKMHFDYDVEDKNALVKYINIDIMDEIKQHYEDNYHEDEDRAYEQKFDK